MSCRHIPKVKVTVYTYPKSMSNFSYKLQDVKNKFKVYKKLTSTLYFRLTNLNLGEEVKVIVERFWSSFAVKACL